jgi:anti-sigma factor RsiW
MTHHDIEELLGAYALDAVDPDEARRVEAHLAECPRCRAEVADHREVAALLTSGATEAPPDRTWDRIAAELGDAPPPVPIEVALGRRRDVRATRSRGVLTGLAAAAAVVVIAVMGAVLVQQRGDLSDVRRDLAVAQAAGDEEVAALLADPATQVVDLDHQDGSPGARAIVGEDGDAILLAAGLPDLGPGRTYQLWGLPSGDDTMVSLGTLGPRFDRSTFHVEGPVDALAISREPGGGSVEPTTDPVVTGAII